ncbi:MAG: oligosaccharide flippase family protein [Candidatus Mycalebacterium zealandia]|nr:MAG: oligosaccharide flippase family protein [Candidatus Mycalebacterium zealandia]
MNIQPPQDERKSLRKDAATLFAGGMGASIFTTLEVVFLARFLDLEQFGVFTLVLSYVTLVNAFVDFRIREASVKYISEYCEKNDKTSALSFIKFFYLIDFLGGILAFVVCVALAEVANEFFIKSENTFQYVLILSLSLFVLTVNQNSNAILQALKKFRESAFLKVVDAFVKLALIVLFFVLGFGLKGFFIAYVIAAVVNFAILQFYVNRTLKLEGMSGWLFADLSKIKGKMREVIWFVLNINATGFVSFSFSTHIPILLLGHFSGVEASGLYRVAKSVVSAANKITGPVYSVLYPALVRLETRKSYDEFRQLIVYSVKEIMKFLLPVCVFLFVFAYEFIEIVFGSEFTPATDAMRVLTGAMVVGHLCKWSNFALLAFGMPGTKTVFSILFACVGLASMFILIPDYSYLGAAWAFFIPEFLSVFVGVFVLMRVRAMSVKGV